MRAHTVFLLTLALVSGACHRAAERQYTLQGQILTIAPDRKEALIKHEDIKGLMPAMTMAYKVRDAKLFEGIAPGDLINATLVIVENDAYLSSVRKVGSAPLPQPEQAPSSKPGFAALRPGDPVPDASFVDQDGRPREFASFKGSTVVLTFIYTRCPMPNFCPLMDRNFATIQKRVKQSAPLRGHVQLVSVSFDPITDTPPVLKKHARSLDADPAMWTFLTGKRDDIDSFAASFGVEIFRSLDNPLDITHTLRTAIVGPDGKVRKIFMGNEWTPDQVLAALQPGAAAN